MDISQTQKNTYLIPTHASTFTGTKNTIQKALVISHNNSTSSIKRIIVVKPNAIYVFEC